MRAKHIMQAYNLTEAVTLISVNTWDYATTDQQTLYLAQLVPIGIPSTY